jgi:cytochrome c oxidase subunit 3
LLISSYPASRLRFLFETERYGRLIRALTSTLFFGILFGILQLCGWSDMQANLDPQVVRRQSEFMYVLSGLHLVHLLAVVGVTVYYTVYYSKKLSNPIHRLVVGTNPFEGLRLSMLSQVWLFLHIVWAVIFTAFLMGQT